MRMTDPTGRRYVEITRRLNNVNALGALGISLAMLLDVWGDTRHVVTILASNAALIAFNTWITLRVLPRTGMRRGELLRTAVNLGTTVVIAPLTGWPTPIWFWIPFVALAYDHLGVGVTRLILAAFCVVLDTSALLSGVWWLYPLAFTAFGVFCAEISRIRFDEIRGMLVDSDDERVELAKAHAEINQAHTQLTQETHAREQVEIELRQAQKLEAVGRLASGIAHDINTPVQFVSDSVVFMNDASRDLLALIERYRLAYQAVLGGKSAATCASELADAERELDFPYVSRELPLAAARSLDGLERIASIVRAMKEFAHPDQKEMRPTDLNAAIKSTLIIARGEYKHVAELEVDLTPLPDVFCHVGEINQVILNLLVNAAHAIGDATGTTGKRGTITVRTRAESGAVTISIADTGTGIPDAIRERIFEPFFTTKEVGRGSGQGLALARAVVRRHEGTLTFASEVGVGTTFTIRLPILQSKLAA